MHIYTSNVGHLVIEIHHPHYLNTVSPVLVTPMSDPSQLGTKRRNVARELAKFVGLQPEETLL